MKINIIPFVYEDTNGVHCTSYQIPEGKNPKKAIKKQIAAFNDVHTNKRKLLHTRTKGIKESLFIHRWINKSGNIIVCKDCSATGKLDGSQIVLDSKYVNVNCKSKSS